MDKTTIFSIAAIAVSAASFVVLFSQLKISSAKTRLDLHNKRFSIYLTALEYYQATSHESTDKILEKSINFTKSYRESRFLFDPEDGVYETLGKIQQNGSTIYFYEKNKYERDSHLTEDTYDLSALHESSVKARNEFEVNLNLLENQIEKYIRFTNIAGWRVFK
ncbi:hypothetical protein [Methylococcus sp. EFPC2]|uniref:hypothetical protein n=1 Tax=Methylococcus sp. EFPC2 TaxID=2812648 RepID=UPI00196733D8|nr:hypothetical protein [Methylococcus sp. EFPC2]QSA96551.1 hypothetical protein JWZ97_15205 [Methylococcus sp. EFPC2]